MLGPTHLDGALLDHVYLHKTFEYDQLVISVVNNIYSSDHDAVPVQLRFSQNSDNDFDFNIRVSVLLYCYKGFMNTLIFADGSVMYFFKNLETK